MSDVEKFDEAYYKEFCERHGNYDVVRPVRRILKQIYLPLPANPTLSDFAIGYIGNFKKWQRVFSTIYGYDVNATIVDAAAHVGLSDYFVHQDVTVPFEPKTRTNVCVCFYLFEHIKDERVVATIQNMVKTAPLNVIGLTPVSDIERYVADPTHINPKGRREWSRDQKRDIFLLYF